MRARRETYGFIGGSAAVSALKLSICIIYITYEYIALICLGVLTFIPERSSFVQICVYACIESMLEQHARLCGFPSVRACLMNRIECL